MPVNVTEQLPVEDNVQLLVLSEPPVVPTVNVKVTEPVGVFELVVVSGTVAVTVEVQLVAPNPMLHVTPPILVDVLSLPVTVTETVAAELVLVL